MLLEEDQVLHNKTNMAFKMSKPDPKGSPMKQEYTDKYDTVDSKYDPDWKSKYMDSLSEEERAQKQAAAKKQAEDRPSFKQGENHKEKVDRLTKETKDLHSLGDSESAKAKEKLLKIAIVDKYEYENITLPEYKFWNSFDIVDKYWTGKTGVHDEKILGGFGTQKVHYPEKESYVAYEPGDKEKGLKTIVTPGKDGGSERRDKVTDERARERKLANPQDAELSRWDKIKMVAGGHTGRTTPGITKNK